MEHVLVLSYFSAEEVERYKLLATVLRRWKRPDGFAMRCVVCSVVTGIDEDPSLPAVMSELMPTTTYRCQTQIVGYPARPTAMFWEIMAHVASLDNGDGGFALWMEADMVPRRPSWLDDLHREWLRNERPLIMGRLMPRTYIPTVGIYTPTHINGGACYAKDYARVIPDRAKWGVFDTVPWQEILASGRRAAPTGLFAFGTLHGLDDDMRASPAAVLHGYRQDKPAYYARWLAHATGGELPALPREGARCCDLYTRHLTVAYCPIHSERTVGVRLANLVSLAATVPYFAVKRRWRLLKERVIG